MCNVRNTVENLGTAYPKEIYLMSVNCACKSTQAVFPKVEGEWASAPFRFKGAFVLFTTVQDN